MVDSAAFTALLTRRGAVGDSFARRLDVSPVRRRFMVDIGRCAFLARRNLRNALIRYRYLTPGGLVRDHMRARQLRREAIDPRAKTARPERVVISLTSIPARAGLIAPALRSLLDQTVPADRIILAWPWKSLRGGEAYPEPSAVPAGVDILRCEDQGPATKLLPALLAEPGALIVVVDDDVIYPHDFIETLLDAHRRDPAAALGYRGWRLRDGRDTRDLDHVFATALKAPVDVDILFGTWGYLVPPGALDAAVRDFSGFPDALRWVDDVWVSGHLKRRGVPRRVVAARSLPLESRASFIDALTDGLNRSGANDAAAIAAFAPWS